MTITKRISGTASAGSTSRVSEEPNIAGVAFLLLEGDAQVGGADRLMLEGDEDGLLLLEGDDVADSSPGTEFTKRTTATPSGGVTKRVTP